MSSGNIDNRSIMPIMIGMNSNPEINQLSQKTNLNQGNNQVFSMSFPSNNLQMNTAHIPMNMPMNMHMNMPMNMMFNPMMMAQNIQGQINPNFNPNFMQLPNSHLLNKPNSGEYRKVWVGHIPPILSDTFILKLLETCGTVASWKRTTDHMGRPKGFGLCEYHTVESMLKSLRLLNHLKLQEGYELSIKVDSKTEEFLKQWREQKKQEWIDNLRRRGIEVNIEDIKKRESNREPLEWELQLISKDSDTRKLIFEILTQKNEIEMYAKQNENPEEFLKDLKDLTTNNPFASYLESEREKERGRKKAEKLKKLEKQWKEDEKHWEKHEEDRDRHNLKQLQQEEENIRRKKRLIEKDLNFNSDEEKRKIKQNPKKIEEFKQMREKEKELDNQIRKKENPKEYSEKPDDLITDLALINNYELKTKEPEAKTIVICREYDEDIDNEDTNGTHFELKNISLNLETKKNPFSKPILFSEDADDLHDIYNKKSVSAKFEINPETEKEILQMKREIITYEYEEKNKAIDIGIPQNSNVVPNPVSHPINHNKILEIHKQVYESIPKNTDELFKLPINWNVVYKYEILENKIKPWLGKKLLEYLGEDEPELKGRILKKLSDKTNPYELMEKIRSVFEEDTEVN